MLRKFMLRENVRKRGGKDAVVFLKVRLEFYKLVNSTAAQRLFLNKNVNYFSLNAPCGNFVIF